jgi:hypothetical protein
MLASTLEWEGQITACTHHHPQTPARSALPPVFSLFHHLSLVPSATVRLLMRMVSTSMHYIPSMHGFFTLVSIPTSTLLQLPFSEDFAVINSPASSIQITNS